MFFQYKSNLKPITYIPPTRKDLVQGIPYPSPCEQIDRHLWKHYLPTTFLAVSNSTAFQQDAYSLHGNCIYFSFSCHHQMLLLGVGPKVWCPGGGDGSPGLMSGGRGRSPDLMSGKGGVGLKVWCLGLGRTLPCDLSCDAFDVTYPLPSVDSCPWKHCLATTVCKIKVDICLT